jgi:hypothetical protein
MSDFLIKQIEATETTIKALQEHAESLRNMMEKEAPKKWSPIGGDWCIDDEGIIFEAPSTQGNQEFGHERQTEKQAIRAALEMRKFNRLLALRDELCGDDFPISCTDKYFICYNDLDQCYIFCSNQYITQIFGLAYFPTIKLAQKACDMLNSGEVEL